MMARGVGRTGSGRACERGTHGGSRRPAARRLAWYVALSLCADAAGQAADRVTERAEDLRAALAEGTESALRSCLAPEFLELVPPGTILGFSENVRTTCGDLREAVLRVRRSDTSAVYEFATAGGYAVPAAITIDSGGSRIRDLRVWWPWRHFRTRGQFATDVAGLGDATALYAAEITGTGLAAWADVRGSDTFSIASMMKLWILICISEDVAAGRRSWKDDVELREEDMSWSASRGVMEDWPAGTRQSLQAAAALMIGESDNTAADMLLRVVGRSRIEAVLRECREAMVERNTPVLSTRQVWTLKYHLGGKLGAAYVALPRADRQAFLDREIAGVRARDFRVPSPCQPTYTAEIGWFASAKDLAWALRRLWELGSGDPTSPPLAILGIHGGRAFPEWFADYVGVKAGSDWGVRTVGYLARTGGRWHVVVCLVNGSKEVPEGAFWAVAAGSLAAAGRELPD